MKQKIEKLQKAKKEITELKKDVTDIILKKDTNKREAKETINALKRLNDIETAINTQLKVWTGKGGEEQSISTQKPEK